VIVTRSAAQQAVPENLDDAYPFAGKSGQWRDLTYSSSEDTLKN
jgi:hypothetical protein